MAVRIVRGYYGPELAKKGDVIQLSPLEEERLVDLEVAEYVERDEPILMDVAGIMKEKSKSNLLAFAKSNQIPVEGNTLKSIRDSILNFLEEQEDRIEETDSFEGE